MDPGGLSAVQPEEAWTTTYPLGPLGEVAIG